MVAKMSTSGNGDDADRQGQKDTSLLEQKGLDANMAMLSGTDRSAAMNNSAAAANQLAQLNGMVGFGQNAAGGMNASQLLEEKRRLMFLEQAQTNQRNMFLRQGDFGSLSNQLSRNALMNQQLLMNQAGAHQFMMDPLLGAAGSPSTLQPTINPELLFASGAGGNLRQSTPALPGLLNQHANVANFPAAGLNPSIHQQHLHAMNQMSSIIGGNVGTELGLHDTSGLRADMGAAGFPKMEEKKEAKAADMPIRPLSAYNFFFREERERILSGKDGDDEETMTPEEMASRKKKLLEQHLSKDRSRRRPHRKTHGKIGFTTLSKLIGTRWRGLSDEKKQYYRDVAAMDMDRYQKDVADYNKGRLFNKAK